MSRIMAERLGSAGVQMLAAELTDGWEISGEQEEYQRNADPEGAIREYESCLETAAEQTGGEGTAFKKGVSGTVFLTDSEMVPEDSASQEVPENFQNPIDIVLGMRTMGILTLAIPDPANLSAYTLGEEQLVSRRTLQQGMGMLPRDEDGTFDRLLMLEFLAETFPCYTSQSQEEGLKYQVEYAIGRKNSDRENLKTVLDRLMMIRGASNFLYLMTSSVRGAEADQMAWIISLALLMPQIQPLVFHGFEGLLGLRREYSGSSGTAGGREDTAGEGRQFLAAVSDGTVRNTDSGRRRKRQWKRDGLYLVSADAAVCGKPGGPY